MSPPTQASSSFELASPASRSTLSSRMTSPDHTTKIKTKVNLTLAQQTTQYTSTKPSPAQTISWTPLSSVAAQQTISTKLSAAAATTSHPATQTEVTEQVQPTTTVTGIFTLDTEWGTRYERRQAQKLRLRMRQKKLSLPSLSLSSTTGPTSQSEQPLHAAVSYHTQQVL